MKHLNFTNGKFYEEGFPLRNIKTRPEIKQRKVRDKHFIKTVAHSWRVSTKIMKLNLNKSWTNYQEEGRACLLVFSLYHAKLALVYLHSL